MCLTRVTLALTALLVFTFIIYFFNGLKFMNKNNKNLELIEATKAEADYIDDKITDYCNSKVPFTQKQNIIFLNYVVKDNVIIVAGIKADIYYWNILYIQVLWVDEKYRGQKLGTKLLNRVEQEAKDLGVKLVHLDTFDFQAPEFYLKHGYEIFGTLDDCPKGHKRYYMKKRL